MEWDVLDKKWDSKLRVAHIFEQFQFFPNGLQDTISTIGKAIRYTTNYDFTYRFTKNTSLKTIVDYTTVTADGTNSSRAARNIFSGVALWSHRLSSKSVSYTHLPSPRD